MTDLERIENGFGNYTLSAAEATLSYDHLEDEDARRTALWIMGRQGPRAIVNFPEGNEAPLADLLAGGLVNELHRIDPVDGKESVAYQLTEHGYAIAERVADVDREREAQLAAETPAPE